MTAFDVFINDRKVCRAGVGADGVLSAIVHWVRLKGPAARTARRMREPLEEARIHVGGLRDSEHQMWVERDLHPGDRVSVHVVKAKRADLPASRTPRRPHQHQRPDVAYPETTFLNVDLDLWSRTPLEPLVHALGSSVIELFVGHDGRQHAARLEWARSSQKPDVIIQRLVAAIERLPRPARRLWNHSRRREFNIGIQAAMRPHGFELRLDPATVQAVARVGASMGVTVYAPERPPPPTSRDRARRPRA
jgi:hypothetical protein